MSFGLDYTSGPPITAMKDAAVSFVCRYTGYFSGYDVTHPNTAQGKVLTPGEALSLSKAGIAVVSNWEWYANRALAGHDAGVWDADKAQKIHHACGGPADRPIYFSVDVDVAESQVLAYFKGVASVLGLHRTGAYSSYRVMKALFDANAITWGWQTYAWSYGAREGRSHIYQYENRVSLAGHSVDYNHSLKSDFGQWHYGGEENVSIDIHTPGVAQEFKEIDAQHWQSLRTGKVIQHGLLATYKKYGNSGKCGLDFLGHPESNEQTIGTNKVRQFFDKGVLCWDNGNVFPLNLYDNGPGTDTRIAIMLAQIAALQQQVQEEQQKTAPPDPILQQKLDQLKSLNGQMQALVATL